jgi:hypothetical protein
MSDYLYQSWVFQQSYPADAGLWKRSNATLSQSRRLRQTIWSHGYLEILLCLIVKSLKAYAKSAQLPKVSSPRSFICNDNDCVQVFFCNCRMDLFTSDLLPYSCLRLSNYRQINIPGSRTLGIFIFCDIFK